MKKRILPIVSMLLLTASMFYFSGCKDAVEDALSVDCYTCTHPDPDKATYPDQPSACEIAGIDPTIALKSAGYSCTKN